MIGWSQLLELSRPLPQSLSAEEVASKVGGKRLALGSVGRRANWPQAAHVVRAIDRAAPGLPEIERQMLLDLVRSPLRAYVLRGREGAPERYALVGSWDEHPPAWAEVVLPKDAPSELEVVPPLNILPTEAPTLADELIGLYEDVDPSHRPRTDPNRNTLDRGLWIGGSVGETATDLWEHQLAALFASRGLDVQVMTRPGDAPLPQALARVEQFRGARIFVWVACAGDRDRRERLIDAAKDPVVLVSERDFALVLTEAAIALDERDQELAELQHGIGGPAPGEPTAKPLAGGPYYFKKTGSGGGNYGDRMELRNGPCTHNSFRRAKRADQAKRGIARVANAQPIKLEHCDSCTGGGFWRASFPNA